MMTQKNNLLLGILFMSLSLASCRVSETNIQPIDPINTLWINNQDSVRILCSTYYLKNFDNTQKSRKSRFKSDLVHAKTVVYEALKELYAHDSLALHKFVLYTDSTQIKHETYIDMQVHTFVNWWVLVPMAKVRESYCVRSSIISNGKVIKTHEEWGFRKTLGEFYDLPDAYWECDLLSYQLKLYCIKRSLLELMRQ
jgi:hypothetical protein